MFRFLRRSLGGDAPSEAPPVDGDPTGPAGDYRSLCRALHQAFLASEEGRITREAYLDRKVVLLRHAVKAAEEAGEGPGLVAVMQTLRLTCAVNDVEVASVTDHFARPGHSLG